MQTPFYKFKKDRLLKSAEVAKFIYEVGEHPMLRQKSKEIPLKDFKSPKTKETFRYVKKCLLAYREVTGYGRGLTAVQVGIPLSFSAIYKGDTVQNKTGGRSVSLEDIIIVANPKITKVSKALLTYPEMCMSLSPVVVPTVRPSWVEFSYYDENGAKKFWTDKGDTPTGRMMNRVLMHEIDHIKGIVNIDLVKNPREITLHADPDFYKLAKFKRV